VSLIPTSVSWAHPTGPASGAHRTLRGGAWDDNGRNIRVSNRVISPPTNPQEIKSILPQAMVDVDARKLDLRIASTLTYMAGALLKAFETTEVQERLARLEADMQNKADKHDDS